MNPEETTQLEYAVDTIREAILVGAPLANDALQEILWQIRLLGIVQSVLCVLVAMAGLWLIKRSFDLWSSVKELSESEAVKAVETRETIPDETLTSFLTTGIVGPMGGLVCLAISAANIGSSIKMAAAPAVWLLQNVL